MRDKVRIPFAQEIVPRHLIWRLNCLDERVYKNLQKIKCGILARLLVVIRIRF